MALTRTRNITEDDIRKLAEGLAICLNDPPLDADQLILRPPPRLASGTHCRHCLCDVEPPLGALIHPKTCSGCFTTSAHDERLTRAQAERVGYAIAKRLLCNDVNAIGWISAILTEYERVMVTERLVQDEDPDATHMAITEARSAVQDILGILHRFGPPSAKMKVLTDFNPSGGAK